MFWRKRHFSVYQLLNKTHLSTLLNNQYFSSQLKSSLIDEEKGRFRVIISEVMWLMDFVVQKVQSLQRINNNNAECSGAKTELNMSKN